MVSLPVKRCVGARDATIAAGKDNARTIRPGVVVTGAYECLYPSRAHTRRQRLALPRCLLRFELALLNGVALAAVHLHTRAQEGVALGAPRLARLSTTGQG